MALSEAGRSLTWVGSDLLMKLFLEFFGGGGGQSQTLNLSKFFSEVITDYLCQRKKLPAVDADDLLHHGGQLMLLRH